jgi:hypothetical protein
LQLGNLWLQVLNDYMYDFNHKLLFWVLCVKSHILVGHVTSRWWGGNKMRDVNFHHFYFICMTSMIDDKVMWTSNYHTIIKKWLQVIWYEHRQSYPPTNLCTYLFTYPPTYLLPNLPHTHPPTHLLITHPLAYLATHHPHMTHLLTYLPT